MNRNLVPLISDTYYAHKLIIRKVKWWNKIKLYFFFVIIRGESFACQFTYTYIHIYRSKWVERPRACENPRLKINVRRIKLNTTENFHGKLNGATSIRTLIDRPRVSSLETNLHGFMPRRLTRNSLQREAEMSLNDARER